MRQGRRILLLTILLASSFLTSTRNSVAASSAQSFKFAAAGDHNQSVDTNSSLRLLASSGVNFYLALGDLSYSGIGQEAEWCDIVKSYLGPSFPFELVSGLHDDGLEAPANQSGLIDSFANCLPDRIGVTGIYGKEYYFDYPSSNPLARIIMVSPALNFTDAGYYSYALGSPHYGWVSDRIDDARAARIPWVIVAMHKPCISAGVYGCVAGIDLMNLLIQKRVDLVLQAHDHDYQRSKQLTCASTEKFVSSCVADDGSSGSYWKTEGTIFVIAGTFGQVLYRINMPALIPYFAKVAGANTPGMGHGFVEYTVTADEIQGQTDFSGIISDTFRIVRRDLQGIILYVKDNIIFVSLLTAPFLVGITVISIYRWKRWPRPYKGKPVPNYNGQDAR